MCERANDNLPRVEAGLEALFTTPVPDTAFVTRLERQLVAREAFRPGKVGKEAPRWPGRRRWAAVVLGLALVLIVTIVAVGPQEVWAGLQRLLGGYLPGLGFVNLEQAWMLPEPVEVSREGVTVRIEHVVASPDSTVVQFSTVDGIRHLLFPVSKWEWDFGRASDEFEAFLRLPDDQRLEVVAKVLRVGGGTLAFPPLPGGTEMETVILELPRLPLLSPGEAPEHWEIPLPLRAVTEEVIADLDVQVYTLSDGSDTYKDITLRVLEVAHGPDETAVHVRVDWEPEVGYVWVMRPKPFDSSLYGVQLHDGHIFYAAQDIDAWSPVEYKDPAVLFGQGTPAESWPTSYEDMWTFSPLWHSPYSLTLQLAWVDVFVPVEGVGFTLDLGDAPQAGGWQPLDETFVLDGRTMHITRAKLEKLPGSQAQDQSRVETDWKLSLEGVPVEWERGGRVLGTIMLWEDGNCSAFGSIWGGGWTRELGDETWRLKDPDAPLRGELFLSEWPAGQIRVSIYAMVVRMDGPWTVTWTIPQTGGMDVRSE